MRCENYLELLSPYLDKVLSLEEQKILEAHLEECSKCQEELENLKWIRSCLDKLEDRPLPEDFHEKLMNKVNEEKKSKINKNKIFAYASSLAAVMILAVVFISQDHKIIVPSELSIEEPEIASYSMQKSIVEESGESALEDSEKRTLEQAKRSRSIDNEAKGPEAATNDIAPIAENEMTRAVAPANFSEDTWHITCADAKMLAESVEKISEANGYEVQSTIQDTTIYITFAENIDREMLKQVIEEDKGVEEFVADEPGNSQLTLIITQSTP